jgi:hypothetical protein
MAKTLLTAITALIILVTSQAHAEEMSYLKYGIGISGATKHGGSVKYVALGYSDQPFSLKRLSWFVYQVEAGGWIDTSGEGRKSSLYGTAGLGIAVHGGPFLLSSIHGLGFITAPDDYLGSVPQFFHDLSVGLVDDNNGASISAGYRHISNAGLFSKVNEGRDFLFIKLGLPW